MDHHIFLCQWMKEISRLLIYHCSGNFCFQNFSCKVGKWKCDLLSDHVPISASLVDFLRPNTINSQSIQKVNFEKKKVKWDSYDKESVQSLYTESLSVKLSEISFDTGIDELYNNLLRIIWSVSEASLNVKRVCAGKSQKCRKTKRIYSRAVCEARN